MADNRSIADAPPDVVVAAAEVGGAAGALASADAFGALMFIADI